MSYYDITKQCNIYSNQHAVSFSSRNLHTLTTQKRSLWIRFRVLPWVRDVYSIAFMNIPKIRNPSRICINRYLPTTTKNTPPAWNHLASLSEKFPTSYPPNAKLSPRVPSTVPPRPRKSSSHLSPPPTSHP